MVNVNPYFSTSTTRGTQEWQKHYIKRYPRFFRVETVQYFVALYTYSRTLSKLISEGMSSALAYTSDALEIRTREPNSPTGPRPRGNREQG